MSGASTAHKLHVAREYIMELEAEVERLKAQLAAAGTPIARPGRRRRWWPAGAVSVTVPRTQGGDDA